MAHRRRLRCLDLGVHQIHKLRVCLARADQHVRQFRRLSSQVTEGDFRASAGHQPLDIGQAAFQLLRFDRSAHTHLTGDILHVRHAQLRDACQGRLLLRLQLHTLDSADIQYRQRRYFCCCRCQCRAISYSWFLADNISRTRHRHYCGRLHNARGECLCCHAGYFVGDILLSHNRRNLCGQFSLPNHSCRLRSRRYLLLRLKNGRTYAVSTISTDNNRLRLEGFLELRNFDIIQPCLLFKVGIDIRIGIGIERINESCSYSLEVLPVHCEDAVKLGGINSDFLCCCRISLHIHCTHHH